MNNIPSPTVSPSELFSPSSQSSSFTDTPQTPEPPAIPSRSITNKHCEVQFHHSNETSGRNTIRSRNLKQNKSTDTRSDSADSYSILSPKYHRRQVSNKQGAISD